MNTTQSSKSIVPTNAELLLAEPDKKTKRHSPYEFDEPYIQMFVNSPHLSKAETYRTVTGDNSPHHRQRAFDLHRRLQHEIDSRLRDKALSAASYGLNVLFELAENSKSENIRAAVAGKLLDFGLKFSPPDQMKNKSLKSREELETDIKLTQERIRKAREGTVL